MTASSKKVQASRFARRLRESGFTELFLRQDKNALDNLWRESEGGSLLEQITLDTGMDPLARFLAAEILFSKIPGYPPRETIPVLAKIYATALEQNLTGMANPWGLPGTLDGLTGQHVIAFGEAAIAELKRLLNNVSEVLYGGSEEATFGNSYHYRVKDLAAFYIANIRKINFRVSKDPKSRDKAIEKLQVAVEPA